WEHALVADDRVVRNVGKRHEQIVAADARHAFVLGGTAVQRHVLPDHVPVADREPRRLAAIFLVLWRAAHGCELEHHVVRAQLGRALDNDVRTDARPRSDLHALTDHRIGADLDVLREHSLRRDQRRRMYHPGITMSSALHASWPSTSATVANFQIVRIRRVSVALSTSWSPGSTGRRKRTLSMPAK